jgi:general secretion pathway protein K
MDAELYDRLRPWVCALPTTRLSPININTLRPDQAPLLTMLTNGQVNPLNARSVLERRPRGGWADPGAFWSEPSLSTTDVTVEAREQVTVLTRYFNLRVDVEYGGVRAVRTALLYAPPGDRTRTVTQRWIPEE